MDSNNNTVIFNIRKLGAITNSSLNLKKFMVFSGESGLGKSYTTFLIHYLYVLLTSNRLDKFFLSKNIYFEDLVSDCDDNTKSYTLHLSDLQNWIKRDVIVYLRFLLGNDKFEGDIDIEFPKLEQLFSFKCNEEIIAVGDKTEIYNVLSINNDETVRIPRATHKWGAFPLTLLLSSYLSSKVLKDSNIMSTFLLPPSRGGLVGLGTTGKAAAMSSAGMYQEFLQNMDEIEAPNVYWKKSTLSQDVLPIIKKIINGEVEKEENKLYYIIDKTERIPISAAASSVKELTPIFLLLKNGILERYSILFEEPEAHLHPSMQVKLAEALVFLLNNGTHFQITSHSDYFLRKINDFIKLHKLKKSLPEEEFIVTCNKLGFNHKITLDPNDVGAFLLKRNSDGSVKIIEQNVESGVPFDTFEDTLNKDVINSIHLADLIDEL
ncbi:MAG: AAA family ATPase [Bacteroidales bacterium]